MKRKLIFIAISLLISLPMVARKYIFNAAFDSMCPISIYVDGNQYILTEASSIATTGPGAVEVYMSDKSTWSAYDKDGDRITQYSENSKTYSNGEIEFTRIELGGIIKTRSSDNDTPPVDSYDTPNYDTVTNSETYDSGNSGNDGLAEHASSVAADLASQLGNAAIRASNIDYDGFPYLSAEAGYSMFSGVNTRLRYRGGKYGGFSIFAGIGKEFIFNPKNKDCLTWNVGLSFNLENVGLNFSFGETPLSYNYGLLIDLSYEYFFSNWGIIVNGGIGFGDIEKSNPDTFWSLGIGVAFKLWSK
ncbi:MAG: hypothetical protein RR383_01140 [Muribaculaceae bacterium]